MRLPGGLTSSGLTFVNVRHTAHLGCCRRRRPLKDTAYVVRHQNISDRAARTLFPLPTLWDKARPAATGERPPAGEVYGAALGTTPFFVSDQFLPVTQ